MRDQKYKNICFLDHSNVHIAWPVNSPFKRKNVIRFTILTFQFFENYK